MNISLSLDEFKKLVTGRFHYITCPSCEGKGWYWVHENGEIQNPTGDDTSQYYQHPCNASDDECGGVGLRVVYHD